jgi:hypothetical protein
MPATVLMRCCLLVLLSVPLTALAADNPWRLDVLLDSKADATARIAEIDRLRVAALSGSQPARCLLGRIGLQKSMRGRDFPDADYGDHAGFLNACVLGGDIDAMLVLAELELQQRRPLEAMIWAQAYLKIAAYFGTDEVNSAGSYKVGLLQRIERAYSTRRPSNEDILEYVAGLIDAHGERIVSGCEQGGCSWARAVLPPGGGALQQTGGGRSLMGRFTRDSTSAEDSAMFASYLLEIDESGRPTAAHALDAFPDGRAAKRLSGSARASRYNEAPAGSGPRYTIFTVYVDNPELKLMPDAPANTRSRVRG